jgi:hypothetical protein
MLRSEALQQQNTHGPLLSFPFSSNDFRCGVGEVGWDRDSVDDVTLALESGALGRVKFRADFDLKDPRTKELEVEPATDCGRSGGAFEVATGTLDTGGGIKVLSFLSIAFRARSS